jgi:tetratricopeptide (TPR) repeat protein
MKNINFKNLKYIAIGLTYLTVMGCSSAPFRVISEPEQAEVFIVGDDNVEKSIGATPLTKKNTELKDFLTKNSPGELVNVIVKKDGFETRDIWLPLNAGGNLGAQINLKLVPSTSSSDKMNTAKQIIDQLFKAQQYARTEQLERAVIEVDKVLEKFPNFDRAMTMKAAILYGRGQFRESLRWYENAADVNPELKSAIEMAGKIRRTLKLPVRIPASNGSSSTKKPVGNQ